MSESDPIRVFVTHGFEETDDYLRVFEFLESVDRFYYLNVSKPENISAQGSPEAIKDELIEQILQAEVVVVVPDVFAGQSDLVRYMMDVADANNKTMIAIKPFGGISETDEEVAARVSEQLDWNAREIVDTITLIARGTETQRWEVVDFPGLDTD
jgi:hypothetical protein